MLYLMFSVAMIAWFHFARTRAGKLVLTAIAVIYIAAMIALAISPTFFQLVTARIGTPIEPLTEVDWQRWLFYLSPYFRVLIFVFGVAAALLILRQRPFLTRYRNTLRAFALASAGALVVFHLGILSVGRGAHSPWMTVLVQLVTAALLSAVMLNGEDDTFINRFLSSRPLVFLGEISYSLYLFHFLSPRIGVAAPGGEFAFKYVPLFIMNFTMTLLLSIAFASGMFRLLELPAQTLLRHLLTISRRGSSNLPTSEAPFTAVPENPHSINAQARQMPATSISRNF